MALFEWKKEHSVAVVRFDNDHKKLFSLLNELSDAMKEQRGRMAVGNILQELSRYARSHFAAEEAAMRRANYPGLTQHIAEHRELAAKVDEYYTEYTSSPVSITIDVLYFLRDWLEKHILGTDRAYTGAMKQAGIN